MSWNALATHKHSDYEALTIWRDEMNNKFSKKNAIDPTHFLIINHR